MSTSSSSGSTPTVTVVIGASAPPESLEACLTALEPQVEDHVEVLVHAAFASSLALRERFPWASFAHSPGALVPELWRDGIDAARGRIVALTIAQMVPAPDWLDQIGALHERHDALGGAIDPGNRLRPADWGEYFCRYARDMRPFPARETLDLPGDNAAYKRDALDGVADVYRHGFWEPFVHRRLARDGIIHWQDPQLIVRMTRSAGLSAFTKQRYSHGRQYARDRSAAFSTGRRLVGILAAPAVPFLMTARVLRLVLRKRRYRMRALAVVPLMLWFNFAWAYAEARGYADILRS
jgi:hypothetical protein